MDIFSKALLKYAKFWAPIAVRSFVRVKQFTSRINPIPYPGKHGFQVTHASEQVFPELIFHRFNLTHDKHIQSCQMINLAALVALVELKKSFAKKAKGIIAINSRRVLASFY
jgi:hypothetical protein